MPPVAQQFVEFGLDVLIQYNGQQFAYKAALRTDAQQQRLVFILLLFSMFLLLLCPILCALLLLLFALPLLLFALLLAVVQKLFEMHQQ